MDFNIYNVHVRRWIKQNQKEEKKELKKEKKIKMDSGVIPRNPDVSHSRKIKVLACKSEHLLSVAYWDSRGLVIPLHRMRK